MKNKNKIREIINRRISEDKDNIFERRFDRKALIYELKRRLYFEDEIQDIKTITGILMNLLLLDEMDYNFREKINIIDLQIRSFERNNPGVFDKEPETPETEY